MRKTPCAFGNMIPLTVQTHVVWGRLLPRPTLSNPGGVGDKRGNTKPIRFIYSFILTLVR